MKNGLLILCIAVSFTAWGQRKKGSNGISVSLSSQYYLNATNVQNDVVLPNPIRTKNTFGYYLGVEFERVTRHGLILTAGLHSGVRKHSFSFSRNLADFDSTASQQLNDVTYNKSFSKSLYYINPVVSIGYQKQISKDWMLVAKAGLFLTCYLNGFIDAGNVDVTYKTDDLSEIKTERFLSYLVMVGEPLRKTRVANYSFFNKLFSNTLNVGFVYLGVKKTIHCKPIKSVSAGVEFSRSLSTYAAGLQWAEVKTKTNAYSQSGSIDTYQDQNFSIGLRLGLGFWN